MLKSIRTLAARQARYATRNVITEQIMLMDEPEALETWCPVNGSCFGCSCLDEEARTCSAGMPAIQVLDDTDFYRAQYEEYEQEMMERYYESLPEWHPDSVTHFEFLDRPGSYPGEVYITSEWDWEVCRKWRNMAAPWTEEDQDRWEAMELQAQHYLYTSPNGWDLEKQGLTWTDWTYDPEAPWPTWAWARPARSK
jgi:hypothetical protein